MKSISVIVPAYNEEAFIGTLLERIIQVPTETIGFRKEIVVVDDGSRDATAEIARHVEGVTVLRQENQGKGAAVQHGIRRCTGDYVLVQDADLEYDPRDYLPMLEVLREHPNAAIYGSRVLGQIKERGWLTPCPGRHERQGFGPWMAGVLLTSWTFLLYRQFISDTLTAYKIYPTEVIRGFTVKTSGFETDHELTSKLIKRGVPIVEVPIRYEPRSRDEGKKIRARDGLVAVKTLFRFRFRD